MSTDWNVIRDILMISVLFLILFWTKSSEIIRITVKLRKMLDKMDSENAPKVIRATMEELVKSESVSAYMYQCAILGLKQMLIEHDDYVQYVADRYTQKLEDHMFGAGGRAGKAKKLAAKQVAKMLIDKHPLGKAAKFIMGDQLDEMIAENPEQAIEVGKLLTRTVKDMPPDQANQFLAQMKATGQPAPAAEQQKGKVYGK